MSPRRRRTPTLRATLAAVAVLTGLYVAAIGGYAAFIIAPSASDQRAQTEALALDSDAHRARIVLLRDAYFKAERLIQSAAPGHADLQRIRQLRRQLFQEVDPHWGGTPIVQVPAASKALQRALDAALEAEFQCANVLRDVLDALEAGDLAAARRRLADADRVGTEVAGRVHEVARYGFADVIAGHRTVGERAAQVARTTLWWALLGAALLGLMVVAVRSRLYVPLRQLDSALARVARGDLLVSLPVRRDDELGRLTEQFNQMTSVLRARSDDVRHREAHLADRFGRLFEQSFSDIYVFEATTLRVVQMNQAARARFGVSDGESSSLNALDLIGGLDETAFRALVAPLEFGHLPGLTCSAKHRRVDGSMYPVDLALQLWAEEQPPVFVAIAQDVTEQRRAQDRYRVLVDGARDLIFAVARDGTMTSLNPAFESITGLPRDHWLGRPFVDLLHADDCARAIELLQGTHAEGPRRMVQLRLRTIQGTYRITEMHINEQRKGDEVIGMLGVVRDVTDRVQLEQQYRHAQRMESIGRLAGGVAHDFNNILTAILLFASAVKDRLPPLDPSRQDLEEVEAACARAAALTRQLLAFARRAVSEPRILDLNAVTLGIDRLLRRLIGEDIELSTLLTEDLWKVWADPAQMEQVLVNLAVNARDAMPNGGTITIETLNITLDGEYSAGRIDMPPGDYVMLAVSDTGHGIPRETLEHVFEPFFTTKKDGLGTGLGLATCYGIVKQANGWIWAYSEPGCGATFKIYLPRTADAAQAPAAAPSPAPLAGDERILLVEDDIKVRAAAARSLRDRGYCVLEASNGEEALRLVGERAEGIDLLVTDVVMPQMGGPELADRLITRRPDLDVLFTSGYTENGIVHGGVLDRGVAFLPKPYTPSALARKVRAMLDAAHSARGQSCDGGSS